METQDNKIRKYLIDEHDLRELLRGYKMHSPRDEVKEFVSRIEEELQSMKPMVFG